MLVFSVLENHERCIVAAEQPFQKLHGKARKSVAMGNHNFRDSASTDGVQKGKQTLPFPVKTTARVADELMVGIRTLEVFALSIEIGVLLGGTDSGVANASSSFRFVAGSNTEELGNIREPVAPLA